MIFEDVKPNCLLNVQSILLQIQENTSRTMVNENGIGRFSHFNLGSLLLYSFCPKQELLATRC